MKQFVKFKGGELVHPPKFYNNIINYDRNEKALIKDGWKEYVVEPNELEPIEGKMFYTYYEETDTTIIAKTGLKDIVIPEKTDAEKIKELEKQLDVTDWRIIKCMEYYLVGKELPYDIAELHSERQASRDEINILEVKEDE